MSMMIVFFFCGTSINTDNVNVDNGNVDNGNVDNFNVDTVISTMLTLTMLAMIMTKMLVVVTSRFAWMQASLKKRPTSKGPSVTRANVCLSPRPCHMNMMTQIMRIILTCSFIQLLNLSRTQGKVSAASTVS